MSLVWLGQGLVLAILSLFPVAIKVAGLCRREYQCHWCDWTRDGCELSSVSFLLAIKAGGLCRRWSTSGWVTGVTEPEMSVSCPQSPSYPKGRRWSTSVWTTGVTEPEMGVSCPQSPSYPKGRRWSTSVWATGVTEPEMGVSCPQSPYHKGRRALQEMEYHYQCLSHWCDWTRDGF